MSAYFTDNPFNQIQINWGPMPAGKNMVPSASQNEVCV